MERFVYGNPDAGTVLIQPVDDHDLSGIEREVAFLRENTEREFRLVALKVDDWNRDLSPWKAPAVFGNEDFGGGAAETLKAVLAEVNDPDKQFFIGGYSLAALFALWTAYETDAFSGVAAASPSMWFPGFVDYMKANPIRTGGVYLSLGDREEKARNPVMATVGDRIREAHEWLRESGVPCTLEWNPGNHFRDADIRTAKAFAWILRTVPREKETAAGDVTPTEGIGTRIMITGCCGSGKSTLSRKVADRTRLPLFNLDMIWWRPDESHISREDFDRILAELTAGERWIIEGDYSRTYEARLRACDTLIFLDYDEETCMAGLRQRVGQKRSDIPWVERKLEQELVDLVNNYRQDKRPKLLSLLEQYPEKQVLVFHNRDEADAWLETIAAGVEFEAVRKESNEKR